MNERIKLLAEQASHQSPDGYPVTIPYSNDFAEKFAELIVKECLSEIKGMMVDESELLYKHEETTECVNEALMDAHHNIAIHFGFAEHFGVEEQVQDSKELHTCPYREEIHNDYESLCDCNEEQQHQCAMDI